MPALAMRPGETQRLRGLDALRGVAVVGVTLFHFTTATHPQPILFTLPSGKLGVQLFFMLSGFVILMTLERAKGLADFAVRRVARLYPCYLVCTVASGLLCFSVGFNPNSVPAGSTLPNLVLGLPYLLLLPMLDPSYWTLTYEVIFYAAAGWLFCTIGIRRVEIACLVWLAIGIAGQAAHLMAHHPRLAILLNVDYGDLFVAGMMIYRLSTGRKTALGLAALIVALVLPAIPFTPDPERLQNAAMIGLFAAAIAGVAAGKLRVLEMRPLLFLGNISYPLYLIHLMFGFYVIAGLESNGIDANLAIVAAVIAVVLFAAALHYAVERPAQHAIRAAYSRRDRCTSATEMHIGG